MCGVTTVRLTSLGNYNNDALLSVRQAELSDIDIAKVVCAE